MTTIDDTAPAIPDDDKGITLRDVLIHMQHHTDRLDKKIDGVAQDLKDFHEEFREFAKGVDDLDMRVQDIEDAELIKRIKVVEKKLSLAA